MALKIIKSNATNAYRGYRPHWYGVYRQGPSTTTFNLGVLIRGEPPASGYLGEKGDADFERSRKRAEEKFAAIRREGKVKGEAVRELTAIVRMKNGQKPRDPSLDELGDLYIERIGASTPGNESTIRSGFSQFAAFARRPPRSSPSSPKVRRARTLGEVTRELAVAFFKHIAANHSFSTVKKYAHRLTHIYAVTFPGTDNPFAGARRVAVGGVTHEDEDGEKVKVEKVVHHLPVDRDQLRKLYATAKADPLLYALTVTAASTGLRISDTCLLKWSSIDLDPTNPCIFLTTAKTQTLVAVPIFDYDSASPNYEPDLGEFRRVLESALAEAKDGEKYVFPRAAALYLQVKKTEDGTPNGKPLPRSRWTHPGRNIICQRGKALFARALFADEPEDAEIVTGAADGAKKAEKSADDILAAIAAAPAWTNERKRRVAETYHRYSSGEGYTRIMKATGLSKSTIAYDLGAVESLVGVKVIKRIANRPPSLHALVERTRQNRQAGKKRASLYSWHSLRGTFVLMMKEVGVDLETLRELVGHESVNTTLQYVNPTQKIAAESARQIVLRRNRAQALAEAAGTRRALTATTSPATPTDAAEPNLDALRDALAKLTPEERAQLLK